MASDLEDISTSLLHSFVMLCLEVLTLPDPPKINVVAMMYIVTAVFESCVALFNSRSTYFCAIGCELYNFT